MKIDKSKVILKKAGSVTLEILKYIAVEAGEFYFSMELGSIKRSLKYGDISRKTMYDRIKYLDNQGLIKLKLKNNQYSVKITNKGKIKLIENNANNKRDGKWRMLSFDIPEKLRVKRNLFRRSIKRIGFKQVQKSLWACPYIISDIVEKLIDEHKLAEYVVYLLVEKTDAEKYLNNLFNNDLEV